MTLINYKLAAMTKIMTTTIAALMMISLLLSSSSFALEASSTSTLIKRWYDHVMPTILNHSNDPSQDVSCGTAKPGTYQDRCGYGPRLPLMVISPYAKENFVDHSVTDQTSILKFIEDNWNLGQIPDPLSFDKKAGSLYNMFDFKHGDVDKLLLDPHTGLKQ